MFTRARVVVTVDVFYSRDLTSPLSEMISMMFLSKRLLEVLLSSRFTFSPYDAPGGQDSVGLYVSYVHNGRNQDCDTNHGYNDTTNQA